MRILVDLTKCQGYAQCAFLAPEVFTIQGDEALTYDPHPDGAHLTGIRRAAAACPVQAIRFEQQDGQDGLLRPATRPATGVPVEDSGGTFKRTGRIVIVGASMAGLRAAERLREEGFAGSLTLVGEEPHEPYDRPPLSKQVLAGSVPLEDTSLPRHVASGYGGDRAGSSCEANPPRRRQPDRIRQTVDRHRPAVPPLA